MYYYKAFTSHKYATTSHVSRNNVLIGYRAEMHNLYSKNIKVILNVANAFADKPNPDLSQNYEMF